jgi:hypothetical protein
MDGGFITPIDITQIRIKHEMTEELRQTYVRCAEYLNGNPVQETYINKKGKLEKRNKLLPPELREFTIQEERHLPLVLREMQNGDQDEYFDYLIDLCKARGSNILMLEQMLVHRDKKRLDVIEELLNRMRKN